MPDFNIPSQPSTRYIVDVSRQSGFYNGDYKELVLFECSNRRLIQVIDINEWIVARYRVEKLSEGGHLYFDEFQLLVDAMDRYGISVETEPF